MNALNLLSGHKMQNHETFCLYWSSPCQVLDDGDPTLAPSFSRFADNENNNKDIKIPSLFKS